MTNKIDRDTGWMVLDKMTLLYARPFKYILRILSSASSTLVGQYDAAEIYLPHFQTIAPTVTAYTYSAVVMPRARRCPRGVQCSVRLTDGRPSSTCVAACTASVAVLRTSKDVIPFVPAGVCEMMYTVRSRGLRR